MKSTITYVHRATSQSYRVKFSCGHCSVKPKTEFEREQWYIGKPVACPDCPEETR